MILKLTRWICEDTAAWVEFHGSADFFKTWNGAPDCIQMPKITITAAAQESCSRFWQFSA